MKTHEKIKFEMQGLIARWEQSGLNQKTFCENESISHLKFKYWRTQLNKEVRIKQQTHNQKPEWRKFIPIEVDNKVTTYEGLQITYPNGVTITCPPHTDKTQLSTLIKLY